MGVRVNNGNAVRYIRAIERMHSISAAADELGISQPALSSFLKKTEERLGAAIFDRSSNPLTLTAAGKAYLDYEVEVGKLERQLMQQVSDINDLQTGKLVIGGTVSLNMTLLPKAVSAFTARYPGIDVSIVGDTLPNLAQAALDGDIDAFIATSLQDNGAFTCTGLTPERYFLCVPSNWPVCEKLPAAGEDGFAQIGCKEFALLDGCVFISMRDDQQMGRKLDELLAHYGVTPLRMITVDQALTALAFTGEGVGISLVTEGALACFSPRVKPALFMPDALSSTRTLYVATPNNRTTPRAVDEFVTILLNEI